MQRFRKPKIVSSNLTKGTNKEETLYKAYIIYLNYGAYINRDELKLWLAENTKFHILDSQLINVCFFDINEAMIFLLKFLEYINPKNIKEIAYNPPVFGHENSIKNNCN